MKKYSKNAMLSGNQQIVTYNGYSEHSRQAVIDFEDWGDMENAIGLSTLKIDAEKSQN